MGDTHRGGNEALVLDVRYASLENGIFGQYGEPPRTVDAFADGTVEVVGDLGLPQVDLLGWSLGGAPLWTSPMMPSASTRRMTSAWGRERVHIASMTSTPAAAPALVISAASAADMAMGFQ